MSTIRYFAEDYGDRVVASNPYKGSKCYWRQDRDIYLSVKEIRHPAVV